MLSEGSADADNGHRRRHRLRGVPRSGAHRGAVRRLEVVPRRVVEYRGTALRGDGSRRGARPPPEVALVDELAHTNVPGSGRHEKRWQDVMELLEPASTSSPRSTSSTSRASPTRSSRSPGSQVRERVPDWVVRKADQIELVDSSPEQLRRRMLHGNIYPPRRSPRPSPTSSAPTTSSRCANWPSASWPTRPKRSCSSTSATTRPRVVGDHGADPVGGDRRPGTDAVVAGPPGWPPGSRPTSTSSTSRPATPAVARKQRAIDALRNSPSDLGAPWRRAPRRRRRPKPSWTPRRPPDHPDRPRIVQAQPVAGDDPRGGREAGATKRPRGRDQTST